MDQISSMMDFRYRPYHITPQIILYYLLPYFKIYCTTIAQVLLVYGTAATAALLYQAIGTIALECTIQRD